MVECERVLQVVMWCYFKIMSIWAARTPPQAQPQRVPESQRRPSGLTFITRKACKGSCVRLPWAELPYLRLPRTAGSCGSVVKELGEGLPAVFLPWESIWGSPLGFAPAVAPHALRWGLLTPQAGPALRLSKRLRSQHIYGGRACSCSDPGQLCKLLPRTLGLSPHSLCVLRRSGVPPAPLHTFLLPACLLSYFE